MMLFKFATPKTFWGFHLNFQRWLRLDLLCRGHWSLGMRDIHGFLQWASDKPLSFQYHHHCNEGFAHKVAQLSFKAHMLNLQWFPHKRGLMGSIVGAGSGGSIIWIPLQTAYVNPDNVAAEEVDGEDDRLRGKVFGCYYSLRFSVWKKCQTYRFGL